MKLWNGFLDACAWTYGSTRAPGAPPRPRVFSRAYWSENWELTKKYPWASAAMWFMVAAVLAIGSMEVISPTPPLQEGAAQFRWKLFGLGMCVLLFLPLGWGAVVRLARERRESGNWIAARSRPRAAVGMGSLAALYTGLGIALTASSLPVLVLPGVAAGFIVSGIGLAALFADSAMAAFSMVAVCWRRRVAREGSGESGMSGV